MYIKNHVCKINYQTRFLPLPYHQDSEAHHTFLWVPQVKAFKFFLEAKPSIANKERTWIVTTINVYKMSGLETDWWGEFTMKVWSLCVYSYSNLHVIQMQIKLWQYSIKAYHIFFSRGSFIYPLCLIWCHSSAQLGTSFSHIQQRYKTSY